MSPPLAGFFLSVQAQADATGAPAGARKLNLPQLVAITLNRNYDVTKARLEIKRQEHKRRQAFSDFFPSLTVEYEATGYRYQTIEDTFAEAQDSRRLYDFLPSGDYIYLNYPYRIDPYKSVTLTATLTQPIFSGGKYLAAYKYARLGVDSAVIDLQIQEQDLVLDVHKAYYQLVRSHKLLETANRHIWT